MKGNIFIKRPVMAISISVLILAIGLISLFTLPVEQYPDIAPPTVHVSASLYGGGCRGGDEQCHHATGGEHQRCGRHDVHEFQQQPMPVRPRYEVYFKQGHRPRYGGRQRAEPCGEGAGFACRLK